MSWDEFKNLLAGIGPDTALGRVITIRSEDQADTLKYFSEGQHKLRDDWRRKENERKADFTEKHKAKKADPYAGLSDFFKGLLGSQKQTVRWS